MDWLHKVRATAMEQRKRQKRSLPQYLKRVEGKERPLGEHGRVKKQKA